MSQWMIIIKWSSVCHRTEKGYLQLLISCPSSYRLSGRDMGLSFILLVIFERQIQTVKMWLFHDLTTTFGVHVCVAYYYFPWLYQELSECWTVAEQQCIEALSGRRWVCALQRWKDAIQIEKLCSTLGCWSNVRYLHVFLLFNKIRITGSEVQLMQSVRCPMKSLFMQNNFEFHKKKTPLHNEHSGIIATLVVTASYNLQ